MRIVAFRSTAERGLPPNLGACSIPRAMAPGSDVTTKLRLASGLVLMAFACSHLLNHALGIHSLAAMEAGRAAFAAVWRSPPGTLLLYVTCASCPRGRTYR